MPKSKLSPIIISCGEPAGIGTDIFLNAWRKIKKIPMVYVGDIKHLQKRARQLKINVPICLYGGENNFHKSIIVYPIKNSITGKAGKISHGDSKAVLESITSAVELIKQRKGGALVTLPIHKQTMYECGFKFQGHTEFLAHLTKAKTPIMMMVNEKLKTVPITIHTPLAKVAKTLTGEKIILAAKIVTSELKNSFGIKNPRLAFSGLNPHAGEGGAMGKQELEIIMPAIKVLKKQKINCLGVLSADSLFHDKARKIYDVAMCMYHDQALIPVKTLDFYGTVNVTLGLPIVRTSPDHGTALDIAGSGKANDKSFCNSVKLAFAMAEKRCKKNAN